MGTGTLNNDSCPTRIVGADRIRPLAKRIGTGWLNGICSGFYHPSGKSDGFGGRRPSSVNIVGSEEPPILPASPRGKPRGANQSRLPFIQLLAKIRGYGRMLSAPTGCGEAFGFRHVPYRVYALLEKRQLFQRLPQLFNIDAGIVHHQLVQIPGGIVMVEAAQRLHPDAPAPEP